MIKKLIFIICFLVFLYPDVFAQKDTSCLDNENRKPILGEKVISQNGTSILLRDTCNYNNRLYRFMLYDDQSNSENNLILPAIIIDTAMFSRVETFLDRFLLSSQKLKKDFYQDYRNGVKLLIGYIDKQTGNIFIIIQLLSVEQYESRDYYAHSLFLYTQQSNLKFLIVSCESDQFKLFRSYSYNR